MRKRKHLFLKAFTVVSVAIILVSLNLIHGAAVSQNMTFTPSADTYVRSDDPGANYGTLTSLRADDSPIVYSFTRFTVSGLNGKPVTKAVLKIHANSSSSSGLTVKSVADNSWGETTLTYNNAPTQGGTLDTSSSVAGGSWVSLDVTSFVKGEGTFSFGISTPGSTAINLSSRESGADAPQMVVTVTDTATPTPTNPPASTNTPTPISISGQNMTLVPAADAYVESIYPNTNLGTGTTLRADDSPIVYSFARFSVPSLNGQTVSQAVLRIHANSSSSSGLTVKSVADNSWGETTLTYANAPAQGSTLDTTSSVTGGSWVSLDVTSFVKDQGTYSFGISTPGSTAISLSSRESGADAPQLVLSFSGSATPAPTTAPTATSVPTQAPTNTPVPTQAPTSAPGQNMTLVPAADAYVESIYPNTNLGTATTLRVDDSPIVYSFTRFSVPSLNGQTVSKAVLRIHANSSSSSGLTVKSVADNSWGETTLTYANAPAQGSTLDTTSSVTGGTWVSLDVTSFVKGQGTYSFGISTPGSTAISLSSRESGADAPQLVLSFSGSATPAPTTAPTATPTTVASSTTIQHVFVVVMENHSYKEVWNTSSSPYITSLGNAYARATNYHATTHPSLPNYLDLFGGSNYSITTDCSPSSSCHINAVNLADNLETKGLTWKGYMESMPSDCYLTTSGSYAPKHNPFVYFDDIRNNASRCNANDVPYTSLANDLKSASTTPNYAMITPNLCNDMHDCSVSTGDTWLKSNLPAILNSPACTVDKCLLILTWDEDDGSQGNQVLTIFAGSAAKTGGVTSSVAYNHFSLLRTVEDIFGLPTQTSNDANASPMTDLLH